MPLDQVEEEHEMNFLDHLEELRWHLIRSLIAIGVFSIAAFLSKDLIFHTILLGPSRTDFWTYEMLCKLGDLVNTSVLCINELPFIIQSRQMTGQFTMHITSAFVAGFVVAFPYVFWEIWRFISPGLYPKERRAARGAVFYVSFLFILGILFGYFLVTPISINFLANYKLDESIQNEFDIISYLSTVLMIIISGGLLFQLPIVVFFLTKAGIVTPQLMRTYRRHSYVVIITLSAILTPPDVFSQILLAIPLIGLYQISIYISGRVIRKEASEQENASNHV